MTDELGSTDLLRRLDELEARIARLDSDVLDLSGLVTADNGGADAAASARPAFATVDDWVTDYFLQVFIRPIGGTLRWCDEWRAHPEAVLRLEAMWRSWETLRLDGNVGIATWLTSFADPLISALLSGQGTFASCAPGRHSGAPG